MTRLGRLSLVVACQIFGVGLALAHCPEIHKSCDRTITTCHANSDCPGGGQCVDAVCNNDNSSATQCFITVEHAGTCTVDTQLNAAFDVQDFPTTPDQRIPDSGNLPIVTVSGNAVCGPGPSLPCVIGPAGNTANGLPGAGTPGLVSFKSEHALSAAQLQDLANAGSTQLDDQATVTLQDLCAPPGPGCNPTPNDLLVTASTPVASGCSVTNAPAGTPCQSDNLCESHQCDGNGSCVLSSNVQCDTQNCEVCAPATGMCVVDQNDPRCSGVDIEVHKAATCACSGGDTHSASTLSGGVPDGELVVCGDSSNGDDDDNSSGDDDDDSGGSHHGDLSVAAADHSDHGSKGDDDDDVGSSQHHGSNDQGDDDQQGDDDDDDQSNGPPPTLPPPPSGSPAGCIVGFTITVTNHGSETATNVVVTDVLPSSLVFVDQTASQGTFDPSTGIWLVGTLDSGASATLTIHEDRGDVLGQCIENCAQLTGLDQTDGNTSNDSDCVTVFTGQSNTGDDDDDSSGSKGSLTSRNASGDDDDDDNSSGGGPKCVSSGGDGQICNEAVPVKWHKAYDRWSQLLTKAAQAKSHRQAATSLRKAKVVLRRMQRMTKGYARSGSVSNDCINRLRSRLEALGSETKRMAN